MKRINSEKGTKGLLNFVNKHELISVGKILSFIIVLVILAQTIIFPFGRDQGVFAVFGSSILEGQVPYSDIFDIKPPLIFYIYALAFKMFGTSVISLRIFDFIYSLLTCLMLYFFVKKILKDSFAALIAPPIYSFLYFSLGFWHTAQPESYMGLWIIMGLYLYFESKSFWHYFLSGLSVGIIFLLKYPMGILLLIGFIVFTLWNKEKLHKKIKTISSISIGFIFVLIAVILIIYLNGALWDYYSQLLFTLDHVKLSSHGIKPLIIGNDVFVSMISPAPSLFFLVLLSTFWFYFRRFNSDLNKKYVLIVVFLLLSIISIIIEGKYFSYHISRSFVLISIILSLGFSCITSIFLNGQSKSKQSRKILIVSLLIIFMIIMGPPGFYSNMFQSFQFFNDKEAYLLSYGGYNDGGDFSLKADYEVSDWLKLNSNNEKCIYIWGFEPLIYFLSDRKCCSKYIYNVPQTAIFAPDIYKKELIEELRASKPKYFIVVKNDIFPWVTGRSEDSKTILKNNTELLLFLNDNYYYNKKIEDFEIYRESKRESQRSRREGETCPG